MGAAFARAGGADVADDAASVRAEILAALSNAEAAGALVTLIRHVLGAAGDEAESARRELHAYLAERPELARIKKLR